MYTDRVVVEETQMDWVSIIGPLRGVGESQEE